MTDLEIDRRKRVIFFCGIALTFLTSMSKVLVPGSMFAELQRDLGFSASILGNMGAAYMYCYAASQLALGVLSTRYGGVRIMLFGAVCFTIGGILFPFLSAPGLMTAARALTGLGAGTVFIGLAKLIADLYPEKFGIVLGIALFVGYFGPVVGGFPMMWCIRNFGWRPMMFVVGMAAVIVALPMLLLSRGTFKKPVPGQTLKPLFCILKSGRSWALFVTSSFLYGTYYAIMATLGKKSLEDAGHFSPAFAAATITVLSVIVACNSIFSNVVMSWIGERRRVMVLFAGIAHVLGILFVLYGFSGGNHGLWIVAGYILIAIPAGFFSVFSTVVKELNPPEYVGVSVAILNCLAFVLIAVCGNAAGSVLAAFEHALPHAGKAVAYPAEAYRNFFLLMLAPAFVGLITAFFVPETGKKTALYPKSRTT